MELNHFITQTREGYRLRCPVCGMTRAIVKPTDSTLHSSRQACCKRCQVPIADRQVIEAEIASLSGGDACLKYRMEEEVFRHIEVID